MEVAVLEHTQEDLSLQQVCDRLLTHLLLIILWQETTTKSKQLGVSEEEGALSLKTLIERLCERQMEIIQCVCECFCGIDEHLCFFIISSSRLLNFRPTRFIKHVRFD